MAENNPYRTERLSDSNLKDVHFLYETIFKKSVSFDSLRRKYDTRHTGVKHVTYLAYDGKKPIAFYGALPQQMNYNGELILVVQTCDSLTLPDYQRKGIHKMLALKAYDLMRSESIRFVYAFHSENTFHSCKKLDWKLIYTIKGFTIKTSNLPIAKAVRKVPLLTEKFDDHARNVLDPYKIEVDQFENSNTGEGLFHEYNPAFFKYKRFTNNLIVELKGAKFWLGITSRVSVGDVNFENETDLMAGIDMLKKLTSKMGLNEILFQTTPGSRIEQTLSKHFIGFESWRLGFFLLDENMNIDQLKVNFGDLDTF